MIYYWFDGQDQIWLLTVYDKDEASDLTAKQKDKLKEAIAAEKHARARKKK